MKNICTMFNNMTRHSFSCKEFSYINLDLIRFEETPQGFITYTRCISNLNNGLQNRPGTLQRAKAYKHTEAD